MSLSLHLMQLTGDIAKWEEVEGGLIIEGIASTEDRDAAGEVVEAEAMRKALPEYLRSGSVREMHVLAAGKPLAAFVDEEGRTHLKAKIVDPTTITKIKEGILKMFSIGGKALHKEGNRIKSLLLKEISVVDHGCNGKAHFSIAKLEETTPQNTMTKEELLKLLADPEVAKVLAAAAPKVESPSVDELKKSLGIEDISKTLKTFEDKAKEASEAVAKAERASIVAEATREGKVIPLKDEEIAKMETSILKSLVAGLPKTLNLRKTQPVPQPKTEKPEDIAKFWQETRQNNAATLGAAMNSQLRGLSLA